MKHITDTLMRILLVILGVPISIVAAVLILIVLNIAMGLIFAGMLLHYMYKTLLGKP